MANPVIYYSWCWKSLKYNGSTAYTIFWQDFNPPYSDIPDYPDDRDIDTVRCSWETSYDLSQFQMWNEVCFSSFLIRSYDLSWTYNISMRFQKYIWWSYQDAGRTDNFTISMWTYEIYQPRWYVWVDYDEIRNDATQYQWLFNVSCWSWSSWDITVPFTISWLYFDDVKHTPWYIRVQWTNLCYIDASWTSTRWLKHIINYDSSYSPTYVWTDSKWYVWIPDDITDNHIYYVDNNWYIRRTWKTQARLNEDEDYVWSNYAWKIRVSNWNDSWYAHLCYITKNWYKRRIINWWI